MDETPGKARSYQGLMEHLRNRSLGDQRALRVGRSEIDLEYPELVRTLARIQTGSLTLEICRTIQTLDFKGDSADEIIGSTSIVHRVSLVTRDRRIRRSSAFPLVF